MERIERAPSDDVPLLHGDEDWIPIALSFLEPLGPVFQRARFVIVGGGRVQHRIVVDLQDSGHVSEDGGTDLHVEHAFKPGQAGCQTRPVRGFHQPEEGGPCHHARKSQRAWCYL